MYAFMATTLAPRPMLASIARGAESSHVYVFVFGYEVGNEEEEGEDVEGRKKNRIAESEPRDANVNRIRFLCGAII